MVCQTYGNANPGHTAENLCARGLSLSDHPTHGCAGDQVSSRMAACAAARRAIGTRNGEQDT